MILSMSEPTWWIYILQCVDGSLYTGSTTDVTARIAVHQAGKGAKYTRSHLPVTLVFTEPQPDQSSALKREAAIKKLSRTEKLSLITSKSELK
jgi:predicted GIY-YIG superfamily endonuclease